MSEPLTGHQTFKIITPETNYLQTIYIHKEPLHCILPRPIIIPEQQEQTAGKKKVKGYVVPPDAFVHKTYLVVKVARVIIKQIQ